ncbi:hypothetical protein [Bacillus sp. FJAT-47783]|uniref:hypothetical protein n=1 Tax=Bacillus sp. FJAT-47783 TaxID=2922712 RepID=UPI001FAB8817|nr:hypothetical protein [Bacillus sp. FJAT-47783]
MYVILNLIERGVEYNGGNLKTNIKRNQRLKQGMTDLKQDVSVLKQDVTGLKQGQGRIETKVDRLSSELRSHFKYTNDKLDNHREVFGIVSDELKSVKIDIEFLSSKTGRHDTELNNIMNKLRG